MYIAAGGPGLKQSDLVAFWCGEASFGMELGEVGAWSGCGWFGDGRSDLVGGMWFGGAWKWSLVRLCMVRHGGGEVRFGCDMGGRLDLDRYYRMDWESRINSCTGNAG